MEKKSNIGVHIGAFSLAWISGCLVFITLVYPRWAQSTDSTSEVVTSITKTRGIFERCTFFPNGHFECQGIYFSQNSTTAAAQALTVISFGLLILACVCGLLGGNCSSLAFSENLNDTKGKQRILLVGGILSFISGVFMLTTVIMFAVAMNSGELFENVSKIKKTRFQVKI